MKVFISSMRRGLAEERDYLPTLIQALGHTPLRFEDFGARNQTSRQACLAGVNEADVYLLLLGPHYGDEMTDSQISATEEEFNVARERQVPIYVFNKTSVTPDPEQDEFMRRVSNYQEGRFWAGFSNNETLGVAVTRALTSHQPAPQPFQQRRLAAPVIVPWRTERSAIPQARERTPILEVHVLPVEDVPLRPIATLADAANDIAATARQQGFFGHGDGLTIAADTTSAWAVRHGPDHRGGGGWNQVTTDPYAGLIHGRDGSLSAFQALPSDGLGTLVNQDDLTSRITTLLRHLTPYVAASPHVALAAAIEPANSVSEGDPATQGQRNSGVSYAFNQSDTLRAEPADQIATSTLGAHLADAAQELAAQLIHALRRAR